MRYMIIVKATKDSEAGVLVDGSGLQATSKGWRVRYRGATRTVVDGPFAETTKKFPNPTLDGSDCEIEVRQMFELEDFGEGETLDRFREIGLSGAEKLS